MKDERNDVVGHPGCGESPGAIAHDLRNLLMAVDSNVALARDLLEPDHPARASLDAIAAASRTVAALVGRLVGPDHVGAHALADVGLLLDRIHGSLAGVVADRARLTVERPTVRSSLRSIRCRSSGSSSISSPMPRTP